MVNNTELPSLNSCQHPRTPQTITPTISRIPLQCPRGVGGCLHNIHPTDSHCWQLKSCSLCNVHKENNLLDIDGWKTFKNTARRHKQYWYIRMVNQAKIRLYRTAPKHMFGYKVPRNNEHMYCWTQEMVMINGRTAPNWRCSS